MERGVCRDSPAVPTYCYWLLLCTWWLLWAPLARAAETLHCALSTGYPPYQYRHNDRAEGFDASVLQALADQLGVKLQISTGRWLQIYFEFYHHGTYQCVGGMEIHPARSRAFLFTEPYYHRHSAIFVREDDTRINRIEDLAGKKITGDIHSRAERLLQERGLLGDALLYRAPTKEHAVKLLKGRRSDAFIAPLAVGLMLAHDQQLAVKVIYHDPEGTPVAIAVKDAMLRHRLNLALAALEANGTLDALRARWLDR